jgi:ligand-binding SRPBCC domain-containing protein
MKSVERMIDAGTDRVWSLVADVDRWDDMLPTMQQVTRLDGEGPVGVGARFEVRQPGLPKAVYEITEWEPGVGFTWVAASIGVRTTATHEMRPLQGQTRLTLGLAWTCPLAGLVGLLMTARARRMVEQEADTFARLATNGRDADVP